MSVSAADVGLCRNQEQCSNVSFDILHQRHLDKQPPTRQRRKRAVSSALGEMMFLSGNLKVFIMSFFARFELSVVTQINAARLLNDLWDNIPFCGGRERASAL